MPSWECHRRKRRLSVTRRHKEHKAWRLLVHNVSRKLFKSFANIFVHPPCDIVWVELLDERQQSLSSKDSECEFLFGSVFDAKRSFLSSSVHALRRGGIG